MTDEEVRKWREENQIIITGSDIPKPVLSFDVSPFPRMSPLPVLHNVRLERRRLGIIERLSSCAHCYT